MLQDFRDVFGRALRNHFDVRVMMMNAVGEENTFGINKQLLVLGAAFVTGVGAKNRFERLANGEVVLVFLIVKNVASCQASFGQIIRELLLLKRELVEFAHAIAEDLDIRELFGDDFEFISGQ